MTAGQVFGHGNSCLSAELWDEVIHRNEARREKEAAVILRKKMKLRELISRVKVNKDKIADKNCIKKLLLLVRYKHSKDNAAIPSTKADLLAQWNEIKHRSSPCSSPNNSNDEEEEEVENKEGNSIVTEEIGTTGLVFGHDDSDDESDE